MCCGSYRIAGEPKLARVMIPQSIARRGGGCTLQVHGPSVAASAKKKWRSVSKGAAVGDACPHPQRPVDMGTGDEVSAVISKLNLSENTSRYRLPSVAEWEYAARAGS